MIKLQIQLHILLIKNILNLKVLKIYLSKKRLHFLNKNKKNLNAQSEPNKHALTYTKTQINDQTTTIATTIKSVTSTLDIQPPIETTSSSAFAKLSVKERIAYFENLNKLSLNTVDKQKKFENSNVKEKIAFFENMNKNNVNTNTKPKKPVLKTSKLKTNDQTTARKTRVLWKILEGIIILISLFKD